MNSAGDSPWIVACVAAALSGATLALLELGRARLPHAEPSDRSLHDRPISRVGGLAIWAGFLPVLLLAPLPLPSGNVWLAAWAAVAAVSIADDWRGVAPIARLIVHFSAALLVSAAWAQQDAADPSVVTFAAIFGRALLLVWCANLFNFMDGSDGLAAAMAICGFVAYGVAAGWSATPAVAFFGLAASTFAFFVVNVPPARTFMGDVGAVPLGFLAGVFGLAGIRAETWPPWFPLLVFLPFVADASVTVVRRIVRGEHLFVAHKTHYYQRLHQMGAGHGGTLLLYSILIAGTTASALLTLSIAPAAGWRAVVAWAIAVGGLFAGIDYHWRNRSP
jgi:UDP-N-acetylmuramyl pentapeptide phosphotransferase/UDP-N-acetylglucosamine-1-phosphate transferase